VSFSGIARSLAACGVPAVVGMQYRIKTEIATAFATAFYDSLLDENTPVDVAVERGRQEIDEQFASERDRLSFGLPVLYLTSDSGIARPETPTSAGTSRSVEQRTCPRCGATARAEANACPRCGLKFRCRNLVENQECGTEYDDPLADNYCWKCEARITQPVYEQDAAVEESAAVPDAAAAGGVVSLLRPKV
jgi:hypothetical protein